MRQKKMRLILEEIIMLDGKLYSFLQILLTLKKIAWIEDYVAYIHCDATLINNEPLKIYVRPK